MSAFDSLASEIRATAGTLAKTIRDPHERERAEHFAKHAPPERYVEAMQMRLRFGEPPYDLPTAVAHEAGHALMIYAIGWHDRLPSVRVYQSRPGVWGGETFATHGQFPAAFELLADLPQLVRYAYYVLGGIGGRAGYETLASGIVAR